MKILSHRLAVALSLLLCQSIVSFAQSLPVVPDSTGMDTTAKAESPRPAGEASPDRLLYHENKGFFQSPTGTLLKSAVIPGWGQWSNGKKQKAAIYAGIEAYFFTKAMIWRGRTSDRLQDWQVTCDAGDCDEDLFSSYDSARDRRNYFYWLLGTTIFVSMFDAYADRYLLTLEQTKDKGDDFWGGEKTSSADPQWRLLATVKF
ncbi:MAG: hypothetical protein AB1752_14555 [Candidatus Zixiibacteriota bacterium]